jgi:hypothetical protein
MRLYSGGHHAPCPDPPAARNPGAGIGCGGCGPALAGAGDVFTDPNGGNGNPFRPAGAGTAAGTGGLAPPLPGDPGAGVKVRINHQCYVAPRPSLIR